MSIFNNNCVTETTPTDSVWNNKWNDYAIELDMEFIIGTDKNIAWRYENPSDWVDIHFIGPNPIFQRLVLIDSSNIQPLLNGNTYHFRIEAVGNNHKVWYYNHNSPNNVSYMEGEDQLNNYLTGRPALQASAGADMTSSVAFDNVVVTDLTPRIGLDVRHMSQIDPDWKDLEYDFSSNYNPLGLQEIEEWGCALTSSAMILDFYGYDLTPNGQSLNPNTLNQYLIDKGGYTKNGSVVWSYISKFAKEALASPAYVGKALPSLEFEYPNFSIDTLRSDIEATHPAIIKIVTNDKNTPGHNDDNLHFVVSNWVEDETIYIKDPAELEDNESTMSGKYANLELRQLARFIPSNTDHSYIWIYQYGPNFEILLEHNGQKTGIDANGTIFNQIPGAQYFEEGAISAPASFTERFGGETSTAKVLMLPKPETGDYTLTLSGNDSGLTDTDIHLFDQASESKKFNLSDPVSSGDSVTYTFSYDTNSVEETVVAKESNFETLETSILYSKEQGWISNSFASRLISLLNYAKRYSGRMSWIAKVYLDRIEYLLDRYKGTQVAQEAYDLIKPELEAVYSQL